MTFFALISYARLPRAFPSHISTTPQGHFWGYVGTCCTRVFLGYILGFVCVFFFQFFKALFLLALRGPKNADLPNFHRKTPFGLKHHKKALHQPPYGHSKIWGKKVKNVFSRKSKNGEPPTKNEKHFFNGNFRPTFRIFGCFSFFVAFSLTVLYGEYHSYGARGSPLAPLRPQQNIG